MSKEFGSFSQKVEVGEALVANPDAGREHCENTINKYVSKDSLDNYNADTNFEQGKMAGHIRELIDAGYLS